MRKPNRISMSLFDDELKGLINASAKIFPITQEMIDNNLNPNNYEYGKIDRRIYKWLDGYWDYIIADDVDIDWLDIKNTPISYPPIEHNHSELHTHTNKSILDLITQTVINTWNTVTGKAEKVYVDGELVGKADIIHEHDEINDIELRLYNIENGYTEGHSHPNVNELNSIAQLMIDTWNTVTGKANKDYVDTELVKKSDKSTLTGHIDNITTHTNQIEKDNWNAKQDALGYTPVNTLDSRLSDARVPLAHTHPVSEILDIPKATTVGIIKPTDGSMWCEVIS